VSSVARETKEFRSTSAATSIGCSSSTIRRPTEPFAMEMRMHSGSPMPIPALAHSCSYVGSDINGDGIPDPEVADPPRSVRRSRALATSCVVEPTRSNVERVASRPNRWWAHRREGALSHCASSVHRPTIAYADGFSALSTAPNLMGKPLSQLPTCDRRCNEVGNERRPEQK
jgi:hypothetical protein